MNLKLVRM